MSLESVRAGGAPPPQSAEKGEVLAVLRPGLLSVVQDALRRIGAPPARDVTLPEAVARLVGPGHPPLALLCEPRPEEPGWEALRAAAEDPFGPTRVLVLGQGAAPADPASILAALRRLTGRGPGEAEEVAALRLGLLRGEVAMRYQPIVRIADRAPVGVEGLVRWLRPDGARGATPLGPDAFVPMAERGGLSFALSRAVGRIAAEEMRGARLDLPVSINLPLEVVLRRDTAPWLDCLCREERLRPAALGIELTETTPVRDLSALRHAVIRLRRAGHPVWIDDMSLEENRDALLRLPFTGLKLDRQLVAAIPHRRRARGELERLVATARARGMAVTAEGVTDAVLWRAVEAAGVDYAQGFGVGRPLPAAALSAWMAAWRGAEPRIGTAARRPVTGAAG